MSSPVPKNRLSKNVNTTITQMGFRPLIRNLSFILDKRQHASTNNAITPKPVKVFDINMHTRYATVSNIFVRGSSL